MLCEQCLGTLLGPHKAIPRSCHPLGLEKAPREREDRPSLQEFGEVVRTQSPSPIELPGFQSEGDTKTVLSWGVPGSLVQRSCSLENWDGSTPPLWLIHPLGQRVPNWQQEEAAGQHAQCSEQGTRSQPYTRYPQARGTQGDCFPTLKM